MTRQAGGSTRRGRFSDEPFGVRDIYLDRPEILVEACATGEEIADFKGTGRIGRPNALPAIGSIEIENALQRGSVTAAFADQQQEGAAIFVALPYYCREISLSRRPSQDAGDLEMGR